MNAQSNHQPLGQGVTGLTLDLLAERIDHEREVREAHERAAGAALATATEALDKRLEGMNEFRAQLTEQGRDFVTRTEYDAKHDALLNRLLVLERNAERTAGAIATWRFLAGGGGVLGLVSIALWLIHPAQ